MPAPASPCGSASGSRSVAPGSASRSTRSAAPARRRPISIASSRASPLRGTRRRCWRDFVQALQPRTPRPRAPTEMASSDAHAATPDPVTGPVLFAYDGCDLAKLAIEQAGRQLALGRDALIVCVWQTNDLGFLPVNDRHLNAADAGEVR